MLGVGSIALSLVTLLGRGNRSFAIITSMATVGLGGFMWASITDGGAIPTALGVIALVLSFWKSKPRTTFDENTL